jgi:NAD(P)-dependent dehydrogenase (short-subunit alcohol dehydrogenase family)
MITLDLAGRTARVTGASGGVGGAVAERLKHLSEAIPL